MGGVDKMAGFAYKYFAFLITVHTLLFMAGSHGMVDSQNPNSQHKKFVDQFADENLTEKAQVSGDSGIIQETFSPIMAMSDLINALVGILVSPYSAISGTGLPAGIKLLLDALMGLSHAYAGYLLVRGGA